MASVSVARVYDSGPVTPVVLVGENLGVLVQGDYLFFHCAHVEGLPASRQLVQDLGAVANAASSAVTELTNFRAQSGNMLHLRLMSLDGCEFDLFHGRATGGRHTTFSTKARIWPQSNSDPWHSASTIFVIGSERSLWAAAYNNSGYNLGQTRIAAWGYRYVLDPFPGPVTAALRKYLARAQLNEAETALIRNIKATLVPGEGAE